MPSVCFTLFSKFEIAIYYIRFNRGWIIKTCTKIMCTQFADSRHMIINYCVHIISITLIAIKFQDYIAKL